MKKLTRKEIFKMAHKKTRKEVAITNAPYHKVLGIFLKGMFAIQRELNSKAYVILTKHINGKKELEKINFEGTQIECKQRIEKILAERPYRDWDYSLTSTGDEKYTYNSPTKDMRLGITLMRLH